MRRTGRPNSMVRRCISSLLVGVADRPALPSRRDPAVKVGRPEYRDPVASVGRPVGAAMRVLRTQLMVMISDRRPANLLSDLIRARCSAKL